MGSVEHSITMADVDVVTVQVLVPPGFGQDVREWQAKKQFFPSHQAPSGLDISRPPSSLDCPMSPGESTARLTVKDVERNRTDDMWEGDNGEQVERHGGEPTEERAQKYVGTPADRGLVMCLMAYTKITLIYTLNL